MHEGWIILKRCQKRNYTFDNGRVKAFVVVSKIDKFLVSFELDQKGG
jgi:hypothetical protein